MINLLCHWELNILNSSVQCDILTYLLTPPNGQHLLIYVVTSSTEEGHWTIWAGDCN